MKLVFDIEGDGLREEATKLHCLVAKSLDSGKIYRFFDEKVDCEDKEHYPFKQLPRLFNSCSSIIGHNIVGYDLPLLTRFYGIDFSKVEIVDTFVISYLLDPDRQLPDGCPTSTPNPLTGNQDKIGPHSLEAHGFRLGHRKIHHHDWRVFSPEMLKRCESDVLITEALYYDFMKEIDND